MPVTDAGGPVCRGQGADGPRHRPAWLCTYGHAPRYAADCFAKKALLHSSVSSWFERAVRPSAQVFVPGALLWCSASSIPLSTSCSHGSALTPRMWNATGIVVTNIAGLGSGAIFLMWSVAALCSAATVPRVRSPALLLSAPASSADILQRLMFVVSLSLPRKLVIWYLLYWLGTCLQVPKKWQLQACLFWAVMPALTTVSGAICYNTHIIDKVRATRCHLALLST